MCFINNNWKNAKFKCNILIILIITYILWQYTGLIPFLSFVMVESFGVKKLKLPFPFDSQVEHLEKKNLSEPRITSLFFSGCIQTQIMFGSAETAPVQLLFLVWITWTYVNGTICTSAEHRASSKREILVHLQVVRLICWRHMDETASNWTKDTNNFTEWMGTWLINGRK